MLEAREATERRDRAAIDRRLRELAKEGAARDFELGAWILAAEVTQTWRMLGAATVVEYAEKVLGWEPKTTIERLRVARALESLPALAERLRTGALCWTAVRELTRVATPDTEPLWIASASDKTVRDIETMVAGKRPGALPEDLPDPALLRYLVRFDVLAEAWALWRDLLAKVRREIDSRMSEAEVFAYLLRLGLSGIGGAREEGETRPAYQMALVVCAVCKHAVLQGGGEEVPVPQRMVEQALCDGECIGWVDPADRARVDPAGGAADFPPHVQSHIEGTAKQASRTIPPTTERRVRLRDRSRCQVPGCRNVLFTQVHHILPWSEGGTHADENLLVLCSTHHDLQHEGRLWIDGAAPDRLRFLAADGSLFGAGADVARLEVYQAAHQALRRTGFSERRTRELLVAARRVFGAAGVEPSELELVTEALQQQRRGLVPSRLLGKRGAPERASRPRGRGDAKAPPAVSPGAATPAPRAPDRQGKKSEQKGREGPDR